MPLTDTKIKKVKPREKAYKIADEKGLFLLITPSGSKYWRFKYHFGQKEKLLALGIYPDVSLANARQKRDKARKLLANDTDPGFVKQINKRIRKLANENSFEAIAREWYAKFSRQWIPSHAERTFRRLEKDVFPWIGNRPISELLAPELLIVLRRIESRGAIETAHRVQQTCGQVFRYAISNSRWSIK